MTTIPTPAAASQQAAVDAALLILERMGLSPDNLVAAPGSGLPCRPSPIMSRSCRPQSPVAPARRTVPTGTGSPSSGAPALGRADTVGDPATGEAHPVPPQCPRRARRGREPDRRAALLYRHAEDAV
jgi:hypothetical protein